MGIGPKYYSRLAGLQVARGSAAAERIHCTFRTKQLFPASLNRVSASPQPEQNQQMTVGKELAMKYEGQRESLAWALK